TVPACRQALAWVLPAMPAPITATDRGVEVMADVLSGVGRDAGGPGARPADQGWGGNRSWRRSAAGGGSRGMRRRGPGASELVVAGRPRRSTQADHSPGLAELPLDALEAELPGLRDPQEVPDHGADVDGGEDAVGDHGAEAGHHDREQ